MQFSELTRKVVYDIVIQACPFIIFPDRTSGPDICQFQICIRLINLCKQLIFPVIFKNLHCRYSRKLSFIIFSDVFPLAPHRQVSLSCQRRSYSSFLHFQLFRQIKLLRKGHNIPPLSTYFSSYAPLFYFYFITHRRISLLIRFPRKTKNSLPYGKKPLKFIFYFSHFA